MTRENPEPDDSARHLGLAATVFYGLMSAGGLALMVGFEIPVRETVFGAEDSSPLTGALLGAGAGLLIVLGSRLAEGTGPMRSMRAEFQKVLGTPSGTTILLLAATSAVGEELFFRGALQNLLGVWPTVILFGLLHGGGVRRLWVWTVFATVGGVIFAALTLWTESLLAAIAMHFTVNYFNLHALTAGPGAERVR